MAKMLFFYFLTCDINFCKFESTLSQEVLGDPKWQEIKIWPILAYFVWSFIS